MISVMNEDISDSVRARLAELQVIIVRQDPIEHDKRTLQTAGLLADAGAIVEVVCVDSRRRAWVDARGFSIREYWPGQPSVHPFWPVRVARNLLRMRLQHRELRQVLRRSSATVVHCMNVDSLLLAWRGAAGRPVVYDSWEHFPSTGRPRPWVRAWWLLKERWLLPRVAAVITVSPPIAADLARRYGIPVPAVIYNGSIGTVSASEAAHQPLRLLHLGKFFFDRGLDSLVRAVAEVPETVLTIQGWGEAEDGLRDLIRELGVSSRVVIVPPCAPEDVLDSASRHDVGIINLVAETDSLRWSAANKLFEYMGAGLAVLASDLPVMSRIIADAECGRVFSAGGSDALRSALQALATEPEEVSVMKRNALQAARRYTWEAQAPLLYSIYAGVLSESRVRDHASDDV